MKIELSCDWCGKRILKYPSTVHEHNFCSRSCLASFSSKSKNPDGYTTLKNYAGISENMTRINEMLNPSRMDYFTRAKLSMGHRGSGQGKSYAKVMGRHAHRMVAEKKLGRKLFPGEVVHHIDGNKRNNSPDNLMVFHSQAEHARWHKEHESKGGDAL